MCSKSIYTNINNSYILEDNQHLGYIGLKEDPINISRRKSYDTIVSKNASLEINKCFFRINKSVIGN